ncbi:DUF2607 family protein [Vibrio sp. V39_P1S14PM300]|nr:MULTISPECIES: DUF2607 family protein [Vibrio]NAW56062.1 DUF2607 family protein [Vibrio sp. V36_P2S2PM302]NAX19599.1 DUF2607 family protein [Vibrio sp. V39_P1S14PM300]NAX26050.1 DUF2607 family protein [Vibrio sp. V38_P2S17PM301]NAX29523.1 DUF2607 family protein [Vibrio sp. V37_P2S8PM304]
MAVLCALALTLWLGFASVSHQLDITAEHHQHHDCQLFSSVGQALHAAAFHWHDSSLPDHFSPVLHRVRYSVTQPVYQARSPPTHAA